MGKDSPPPASPPVKVKPDPLPVPAEPVGFGFGKALEELAAGNRVRCRDWPEGRCLVFVPGSKTPPPAVPGQQRGVRNPFWASDWIGLAKGQGQPTRPWSPAHDELLSGDWVIA